jgi:hypothetical protein
MKTLFIVALVVLAMFLAHNYRQTGEIGFGGSLSETEQEIRDLDQRLTDAIRAYKVAGRGSSIGGVADGTGAESAQAKVRAVERQMREVKPGVREESEKERFSALESKLHEAKRIVGLN